MTAQAASPPRGWQLFASYGYPPNELGYCGPPDSSVLLHDSAQIANHAQGFDGAWPYLEEIAAAAGRDDPLDADVVRSYWVGGPLLGRVDGAHLVQRLRRSMLGQPTGLLDHVGDSAEVLAHHSFHVFVVYPWVRFLDRDPTTPMRILQACLIRWGEVMSVDDEHVVIESAPLRFSGGRLLLADPAPERVRWARDGTSLSARPVVGQTVSAHWDWVCGTLTADERGALTAATATTLALVNGLRG